MSEKMTSDGFVDWLRGYLDGLDRKKINFTVMDKIKEKLMQVKKEM